MQNKIQKLVRHVNRKNWWHVPPADPRAYENRGKFYASTFREAEFYGRPLDDPEHVNISKPLVGDESAISKALGVQPQHGNMSIEEIQQTDAAWRKAALRKGYDSILLMAPQAYAAWKRGGKIPRSIELNVLTV